MIMVAPLHDDLPASVIAMHPTCMRFTNALVREQWKECDRLHRQYLAPVIGKKIGNASDGASTRRQPMEEMYQSEKPALETYTLD